MPTIDPGPLDLNLLRLFVILMQERSVTRTARRLSLGQPAVSHALARLRSKVGDALLVRQGRVMEPTPRALALLSDVQPALERIESALHAATPFDEASSAPVFRVGMSDDVQLAFLPRITSALFERVPRAALIVKSTDYLRAGDMLARGDVSTVVSYLDALPPADKIVALRTVRYKVLRGDGHRTRMTLEAYCRRNHVIVTFAGDLKGHVDDSLDAIAASRRIVLSLPQFGGLPHVLRGSDLLATVPEHLADTLAAEAGLRSHSLPFRSPTFTLSMAWRAVVAHDPAERLLRGIIQEVIGGERSG